MDLEAIPGVGATTADRLRELDDPEGALSAGDVAAISRAPGITEGRAASIARASIRHRHGEDGEVLTTDRAREIYEGTLALLQDRAVTDYATQRLRVFYPSATESRIEEARSFARSAMEREPTTDVLDALGGVSPLEPPEEVRVRDRCLATADAETYARARETVPELSVELVEDARALADLARGYSTVVALDEAFAGIDVDGEVRVRPDALEDPDAVVPERHLAFFGHNRDRLRAAIAVHRAAGTDPPLDLDELEGALGRLDADGTVTDDVELDRLSAAVADLDVAVSSAETVANDSLRAAIEERDVTIEGADLLSLVERGAGVNSLLQRELTDEYADAVAAAREHLVESLGLVAPGDLTDSAASGDLADSAASGDLADSAASGDLAEFADLARRAFPDDPTYPVEHDQGAIARLREELTAARDRRATRLKRDLAGDLAAMREPAETLVRDALELDVELAIARFARDFECTMPEFGGSGFAIEGGRCPLLEVPFDDVEPVDYAVSGVSILSGVNSGGKTSTLDLVAFVAVLAQMGLPVPAERARLEHFDAVHYQATTQGTLDAGAFEATLREFAGLVTGQRRRLVLVDELESITEPGASARIIAGILEGLAQRESTAVFVSHLAEDVREATTIDVTVDGIEALGLEDGELQVNRSPRKNHLARSTPELIVEKLAGERETDGEAGDGEAGDGEAGDGEAGDVSSDSPSETAFYRRLLEKFEG